MLNEAHERLEKFYADASNLEDPKSKDGVVFRLSKDDKACGGDGVPLTFLEYDVDGARPVDVFNVLVDAPGQPKWDDHCATMDPLGDFEVLQAQTFAGLFVAPGAPVSSREAYEWMVVDANFTKEEFWVVFSTYDNDDLKQRRPFSAGAVEMQNCLAAYKLTKTDRGTHVTNTQQLNSHSWPLSARYVANVGWTGSVDFAGSLRKVAPYQKQKGWNETQTALPAWMLEDRPCGPTPPDLEVRESILSRALDEMALSESARGDMTSVQLESGVTLNLWQREADCGGGDVPVSATPVWWSEFTVPKGSPQEVFNWFVAKAGEKSWHKGPGRVNFTGFHSGARGVHEEFLSPSVLFHQFAARELWEWQVANHSTESQSYLLAIVSAPKPTTDTFDSDNVQAFQCMAAYQVSPAPGGVGSLVRMSSHLNPNVGVLSKLSFAWKHVGVQMVQDFANALTKVATNGAPPKIDGGALGLLAPAPPDRNASLSVALVAATDEGRDSSIAFLRGYAGMDLPASLDVSAQDLPSRSAEVLKLYQRLKRNATHQEADAFPGERAAASALELQRQGEALASLQLRTIEAVARFDCDGTSLPDWDKNKKNGSIPLVWLLTIGVVVLVAMITLCAWCGCRYAKRRRTKRAARAAAVLLDHRDAIAAAAGGATGVAALEQSDCGSYYAAADRGGKHGSE